MVLLLACVVGTDTGGLIEPPVWTGTQIGEEGDDCPDQTAFETAESLNSLRELLTLEASGTFTAPDGTTWPMTLSARANGVGWDVVDCGGERYDAVDTHITIDGPFQVDRPYRLSERGLTLELEDVQPLSPGELPDDAGTLLLEVPLSPPTYENSARWLLQRSTHWEEAPAGSWVWD